MDNISMKQLRYFDALARLGHFGRAAESCAISQPALSVQIKELENTIGAQLVERGPRSVRLTGLGTEFAARVHNVLRSVDELGALARASGGVMAGHLRIGMIPTIAPYLLPQFAARILAQFPNLSLQPREAITEKLLSALRDGQLDAAVVALPVAHSGLTSVPLFDEEFILVRPAAQAADRVPDPVGLRKMRLLLLEEGHCFRDQALDFCDINAAQTRDIMEGSSLSTLVRMVGAGIGVTLIPEMAVPFETISDRVATAQLPSPRPTRKIGVVWRKSNPLAEQFQIVSRLLCETAGRQPV